MKILLVMAVLLMSAKSFATCTQFNGDWNCSGKQIQINVVQKNGQEFLQGSTISLVVDGQKHNIQNIADYSYRATCQDKVLELDVDQLGLDGETMISSKQIFTYVSSNKLSLTTSVEDTVLTLDCSK